MSPTSDAVRNVIHLHGTHRQDSPPSDHTSDDETTEYHIVFICGNPGLIGCYTELLNGVHQELNKYTSVAVYGESLPGFDVDNADPLMCRREQGKVYGLQAQIEHVERTLKTYCESVTSPHAEKTERKPKIILTGHSVGTYIILELLRRRNERLKKSSDLVAAGSYKEPDIIAGILLFATIVDIHKSPNGIRLTPIFNLPGLPSIAGYLGSLLAFVPRSLVRRIVSLVQGVDVGKTATEAIAALFTIRGGRGLKTMLTMARDEMAAIHADKWDDEIWGADSTTAPGSMIDAARSVSKREPLTNLVFLFGKNDNWVANRTRDDLISLRGKSPSLQMEIEETDAPHDFCVNHNEPIISNVSRYVKDIIAHDADKDAKPSTS